VVRLWKETDAWAFVWRMQRVETGVPCKLALKKRVERITGKRRKRGQRRRERGARLKVVDLFKDERLTGAVLDFLKDTEVGRRYE
jgi:hypothetical protein